MKNNHPKIVLTTLSMIILLVAGCKSGSNKDSGPSLKKPKDTDLEFWITERVTSKDLEDKGCTYLPGWMGAEEYLDSRYQAIPGEGGMATAPDIHVTYLLTGYPDLADDLAVTNIEITDSEITVYGLTINSTQNEITSRLSSLSNSFSFVTTLDECYLCVKIQNCSFCFMSTKIIINVPVTNNNGIIY